MNEKVEKIVQELMELDPSLKDQQDDVRKLVEVFLADKPNIELDQEFVMALKRKLLAKASVTAETGVINKGAFNFMLNKLNVSMAVVTLVAVATSAVLYQKAYGPIVNILPEEKSDRVTIADLGANAFGDLAKSNSRGGGIGGGGGMAGGQDSMANESKIAVGAGGGGGDALGMPVPYNIYKFTYKGEDLDLSSSKEVNVYRPARGAFSSQNAKLLKNLNLRDFGVKDFTNKRIDSLSVSDDKEFGYTAYVDFLNSNISLYQNYAKWNTDEKKCNWDQACIANLHAGKSRATEAEMVEIAKAFLAEQGISTQGFGEPKVHESWFRTLSSIQQSGDTFLPLDASVVFPRIIEGREVRDESGMETGLMVSLNVLSRTVTGVSDFGVVKFEKSIYAGETDASRILKLAEKGSFYNYPEPVVDPSVKVVTLNLGTPERGLLRTWVQAEGEEGGRDVYVEALFFPVQKPEESNYYNKYVVIPLAKGILDAQNQTPSDLPVR